MIPSENPGTRDVGFLQHFVARPDEMAALRAAWEKVLTGSPQFVLLLADSGLGKTRMLHEFYAQLSRLESKGRPGGGYWPGQLDTDNVSLRINPQLPAGPRDMGTMPWFWWGLRWERPDQRNAAGHQLCALLNEDSQLALAQHFEPLKHYLERKSRAREALKVSGEVAASVALSLVGLKQAAEILSGTKDILQILYGGGRWAESVFSGPTTDASELKGSMRDEASLRARAFLAALLDAEQPAVPHVPVILALDDAQWADPHTLQFVRDLFDQAARRDWRLMVIATCWETDWKEQGGMSPAPVPPLGPPSDLRTLTAHLAKILSVQRGSKSFRAAHWRVIEVARFSQPGGLTPLIAAAFPGLGKTARDHLLNVADGNPRVLADLLLQLKEGANSAWFVEDDPKRDLSPLGLRKLKGLPTDHSKIVGERLSRLEQREPGAFRLLTVAAAQGQRFYGALITETARHQNEIATLDLPIELRRAETPLNFVSLFAGDLLPAEFKDRFAWSSFQEICGERWPQVVTHLCAALLAWLDEGRLAALPAAPELFALLLGLLPETGQPPAIRQRWRVLGHFVAVLHGRSRYGEAVVHALELLQSAGESPADELLAALDRPTRVPVGRCLLEARRYGVVLAWVAVKLDASAAARSVLEKIEWLQLEAEALGGLERNESAIAAWQAAVEMAAGLPLHAPDRPVVITELNLRLAEAWHKHRGWRASFRAYRNALASTATIAPDNLVRLRLTGQACVGIAETLFEAGRLRGTVRAIRVAGEQFAGCERIAGPVAAVLEPYARCLTRHGEWQLRKVGGDPVDAVEVLTRAKAMRERLARIVGETPGMLTDLASSDSFLATALHAVGETARAHELIEHAIALRHEVIRLVGEQPAALRLLSFAQVRRGDMRLNEDAAADALADYEAVLKVRLRFVTLETPHRDQQTRRDLRNLLYAWRKCGEALVKLQRFPEAADRFRVALQTSDFLLREFKREPTDLRNRYICGERFGDLARREGRIEEARSLFQGALRLLDDLERSFGASHTSRLDREQLVKKLAALTPPKS